MKNQHLWIELEDSQLEVVTGGLGESLAAYGQFLNDNPDRVPQLQPGVGNGNILAGLQSVFSPSEIRNIIFGAVAQGKPFRTNSGL